MARKYEIVTIEAENRDKGKSFSILEMPPRKAEKWSTRATLALGRGGRGEMPAEYKTLLEQAGIAGLLSIGMRALTGMEYDDLEPLMDEMFTCVSFVPDPTKIDQVTRRPIERPLIDDDIEEVSTILKLRERIIELHLGFSIAAYLSQIGQAAKKALSLNDTSTSPKPSVSSSATD